MQHYHIDTLIIGAGVVGLAVARALALQGRDVWLVEKEDRIGSHTSSRNSEVIHAGLYYPQGSLKARLCVQGKDQLYRYCEENRIPFQRIGKLVVATQPDQVAYLETLQAKGIANGVLDLELLDAKTVHQIEPDVAACTALWSPSTGIVDSHAYMQQLQHDVERGGGHVVLKTEVVPVALEPYRFTFELSGQQARVCARNVVNAAGLEAIAILKQCPDFPKACLPQAFFAKGSYFTYTKRTPFRHLIYPVPEPGGLGIHLTLDLSGMARFGPDVEWLSHQNQELAHNKREWDYRVDDQRRTDFACAITRYWPAIDEAQLAPAYSGIRPKLSGEHEPAADFMIQSHQQHGLPGLINLFGIESPGLTASLAIADAVADLIPA